MPGEEKRFAKIRAPGNKKVHKIFEVAKKVNKIFEDNEKIKIFLVRQTKKNGTISCVPSSEFSVSAWEGI